MKTKDRKEVLTLEDYDRSLRLTLDYLKAKNSGKMIDKSINAYLSQIKRYFKFSKQSADTAVMCRYLKRQSHPSTRGLAKNALNYWLIANDRKGELT